jgi:transcriptional regulator with XRE-family HTH domain
MKHWRLDRRRGYLMHRSLATKLRVLRAERGLTVRQAAELSGVAKETISQIERSERHPYDRTIAKLAHAYDVPVEELLEEPVLAGSPKVEGLPSWATTSDMGDFSERVSRLSVEDLGRLAEALSAQPILTRGDLPLSRQEAAERAIAFARVLVVHEKFLAEGIQPPPRFTLAQRRHLDVLAGEAEGEAEADHGATEVE